MARFPIVRSAARMLYQVALDHQVADVALRGDAAVGPAEHPPDARAAQPSPPGDVAILDHDVLEPAADEHSMNSRALELEAAQDDVFRFDDHIVIGEIEGIVDVLRARGGRDQMPALLRSALADQERPVD